VGPRKTPPPSAAVLLAKPRARSRLGAAGSGEKAWAARNHRCLPAIPVTRAARRGGSVKLYNYPLRGGWPCAGSTEGAVGAEPSSGGSRLRELFLQDGGDSP